MQNTATFNQNEPNIFHFQTIYKFQVSLEKLQPKYIIENYLKTTDK